MNLAKLRTLAVIFALSAAITLVYGQVVGHDFVRYDDGEVVFSNPKVMSGLTGDGVRWAFTTFYFANWHPLTWLSLMADVSLYGQGPWGHHLSNLLLHLLGTAFLFLAVKEMTGNYSSSALTAALYALHPLHVESVAWIAERKGILSSCFALLAIWQYARYAKRPTRGNLALVAAAMLLGLLSKQMPVTLPILFLLLDVWPLGRIGKWSFWPDWLARIREKGPLFLLSLVFCVVAYEAQRHGGALASLEAVPPSVRMGKIVQSLADYVVKFLAPTGLAAIVPFRSDAVTWQRSLLSVLCLAAITAAAILSRRWSYCWLVGWLWFLTAILPVSGIVQVGSHARADRYTDLPLVGFYLAIVFGTEQLAALGQAGRAIRLGFFSVWLLLLGVLSFEQTKTWRNSKTLFEHAALVVPKNHLALNNLGLIYSEEGRLEDAVAAFEAAISAAPEHPDAYVNLGSKYLDLGRPDDAWETLKKAIELEPKSAAAHNNLGRIHQQLGRLAEAAAEYRKAVEFDPALAEAVGNLGSVLAAMNRYEDAIPLLQRALAMLPDNPLIMRNLGAALLFSGRVADAISFLDATYRLAPEDRLTRELLGAAFRASGTPARWLALEQEHLNRFPDDVQTAVEFAWILATHPNPQYRDGRGALGLIDKVVRNSTEKVARVLDVQAAAYAETGDFSRAIATAAEAAELASHAGQAEFASAIRQRLERYQRREPFRELPHLEKRPAASTGRE